MSEALLTGLMVLMLLALSGLILAGRRALEAGPPPPAEPERWPAAALIIPVTGAPPGLAARLTTLLRQDYPDYQVIFCVRSADDPATPVLRALLARGFRARLVVSGPASGCGQKNHNLLAGLRLAGEAPEVLVFGDSNQMAPAHWLQEMIRPLATDTAAVVSGFHHVLPEDSRLATLGRAVVVLTLFLTKGIPRLNQPWGGATAIRRDLFESLQVNRLWAENVVDDVSLAARLIRAGTMVGYPEGAPLSTPLAGETLGSWRAWLQRQWLYLKFCLPGTWLAGGAVIHLLAALMLLAAWRVLAAALGAVPPTPALAAAGFLAVLTGVGAALHRLHPRPGPLARWLTAFYAAILMASWCHLRTWFTLHLCWRGICYRVGLRGKVMEVSGEQ